MIRRLLIVAMLIIFLPLFGAISRSHDQSNVAPFATVVFAGHTLGGHWCDCGLPGCLCDPGETPIVQGSTTSSSPPSPPVMLDADSMATNEVGLSLMVMTLLLLYLKLRA